MAVINLKAKADEIQKSNLLKQLQRLLAQLENPKLTQEQLDRIKADVAACQEKYKALGY